LLVFEKETKLPESKTFSNFLSNIPQRKNPLKAGTRGRPIEVSTNMLQIKFGPKFHCIAVHYDVNIEPNIPKYLMRSVFKAVKNKLFPQKNPAFDGRKNAYSAGFLPIRSPVSISNLY
jgi:hypothetical protein